MGLQPTFKKLPGRSIPQQVQEALEPQIHEKQGKERLNSRPPLSQVSSSLSIHDHVFTANFTAFVATTLQEASQNVIKFKSGGVANQFNKWAELTSDQSILDTIKGYRIDFISTPWQSHFPAETKFSDAEIFIVEK